MSDAARISKSLMELHLEVKNGSSSTSSSSKDKSSDFQVTSWLSDAVSPISELTCTHQERGEEGGTVRILTPEELYLEMQSEINEAAELTCLSPTSVRILLNTFNWNKAKILEQTLYGESFLHLRDVGIIVYPTQSVNSPVVPTAGMINHRGGICLVCRRMTNIMSLVITACDHWICVRCFQRRLMSEIEIGERSHFQCPFALCTMFLDDDTVLQHVPPHLMESFTQLCINDFVSNSKYRSRCPMVVYGCNQTSYYDVDSYSKFRKVQCDCGVKYCFSCGNIWHDEMPCEP